MTATWITGPTVTASDQTIAFSDDELWTVTYDGGPHCEQPWHQDPTRVFCGLPPGHEGPHLPVSSTLLDGGVRLHPAAVFRDERRPWGDDTP